MAKEYKYEINYIFNDMIIFKKIKKKKPNGFNANGEQRYAHINGYLCRCLICGKESEKYEADIDRKGCTCKRGKRSIVFKYHIGDIVENLIITNSSYGSTDTCKEKKKYYNYTCMLCGYQGIASEYNIKNMKKCPCCTGKRTIEHINSIVANEETHWMVDYFQGGWNEARLYTPSSGRTVRLKCPHCNTVKNMVISNLYNQGFSCCTCGDGVSYPEKFVSSLLNICNIEYVKQYSPIWANGKKYDFYIPKYNTIIEVHGSQHYKNEHRHDKWKNYKDEHENDIYKYDIAVLNGFEFNSTYFIIDAKISNGRYIKKSILKSHVLQKIEICETNKLWSECFLTAEKNMIIDVCKYFKNNNHLTTSDIATVFNINCNTVAKYLKRGNDIGVCNYNVNVENKKRIAKIIAKKSKTVAIYKNGEILDVFESVSTLCKESESHGSIMKKLHPSHVSRICCGDTKRKTHKGFTFKYVD